MGRKLRTVDRFFPPTVANKEKPNYFINVLAHVPPKGVRFSKTMIDVPPLSRRQINEALSSLRRSGYITQHRMGMYERALDTPE